MLLLLTAVPLTTVVEDARLSSQDSLSVQLTTDVTEHQPLVLRMTVVETANAEMASLFAQQVTLVLPNQSVASETVISAEVASL